MPVKNRMENTMLKNLLMGDTGDPSFYKNLKNFLQEQGTKENAVPQTCTPEMMKKIAVVLEEEIGKARFDEVRVIISAIQYTAHSQNHSSGLKVLLSNDVLNVLADVFEETQKHVSDANETEGNASADLLMESLLETINDVADSCRTAKKEAVGLFTEKLMTLIVNQDKKFHVRVEAVRTLNLLLEECSDEIIEVVRNHPPTHKLMASVANLLTTAGDFELQVACTEALARLVKRSDKSNYKLITSWFSNAEFASSFMNIQDETFEADCRTFLNHVNEHLGKERSVYSLPCISAYLGSQKLKQPDDVNLEEFWVDFNKVSHRITLYVAEEQPKENSEGGMWETVTIQQETVKKFYIAEMGERQTLFMTLGVPVSELLPSCSGDGRHAHIAFSTTLDIRSAAVAVFGEERARRPKHKHSISQVHVQVHHDDSSGCGSPGPLRYIRSADESSDSISLRNTKSHDTKVSGIDTSGTRAQKASNSNVASGTSTRLIAPVPFNPMVTPSHYPNTDASSVCGSVRSTSTAESNRSTAFSGNSIKPMPRKTGDFAQPKTPVRTSSSVKRVKTPLQITGGDSGNESTTSTHSINKKASISSGLGISSSGTPSKLRQKLQQSGIIQPAGHKENMKTNKGHQSDTAVVDQKRRRSTDFKLQNGHMDTDDGIKSDTTHASRFPQRQLRPRVPPNATRVALPNQEIQETCASHSKDKKASSGEEKNSKIKSSRKFRLYSENDNVMKDQAESRNDQLDQDAVILSSIPTQDSSVDVIPDSLPPSGQPQPGKKTNTLILPSRNQSDFEMHPHYPVAHSPSLSTLTEESTQSSRSKGKKITTPQSSGNELEHFKTSTGHHKIAPSPIQEQIIEDDLQEMTAHTDHSHRKASKSSCRKDGVSFEDKNRQVKRKSKGRSISSGDADDEDDYVTTKTPKASKVIPNRSSNSEAEVTIVGDMTADDPRHLTNPKSLPPSRAFRKVRASSPESSQELSQLEFTSQMQSNPKKGKQRKNSAKVVKNKIQPAARSETTTDGSGKDTRPRTQRAAAKAAKKEILSLSQRESLSSDANKTLTLQFEPSSSDGKSPVRPKNVKKASPKKNRPLNVTQGPFDLSVYEYDSDVEKSESVTFQKRPPLKPRAPVDETPIIKQARKKKLRPKPPPTKSPKFAVFDLMSTDSCRETTLKQPPAKKKPRQQTKPASKSQTKAKAKSSPKKKIRKKQIPSPEELSDENQPGIKSPLAAKKSTKRRLQNTQPESSQDKPPTSKKRQKTKPKQTPPSPELSDIEQPRDAPPMTTDNLLDHNDDDFHDEDVYNFVESFNNSQRHFLGKHFSEKETAEAMKKLLAEKKKKESTSKSSKETAPTKTDKKPSAKERRKTIQQTPTTLRQDTTPRDSATSSKTSRIKTNFGSQITENESEDAVVGLTEPISLSSDGLEGDTVSVDNFSKMCQSMIIKSGQGLAAKRSRRNLPRVDYRSRNSDSEPSMEDLQEDIHTEVSSSTEIAVRTNKKKSESDYGSERSWLANKPKKKVTTYSKVRYKEWRVNASPRHRKVETTMKKKATTKRRQPSPPTLPKKKAKKKPSQTDHGSDEEDDMDPGVFYYRQFEASVSGNQPSQQDTEEVFLGRALTTLGKTPSNKTANKTLPPMHTSTPSLSPSNKPLLPSSQEDDQSSSIEVLRDELDQPDDVTVSPLTPLIMDEQVRDNCLADLVTPKALVKSASISSGVTVSSTKKTPKQVTFNASPSPSPSTSPVAELHPVDETLKSGPSSWIRPTASALKRKYGDLFSEDYSDDENEERNDNNEPELPNLPAIVTSVVSRSGQGAFKPKKLFKAGVSSSTLQEDDVASEDAVSDEGASSQSSASHPSRETVPAMNITKMLKAVGETLKKKMQTKQAQTQQLTEGAVKTTQRQFFKLLNRQFQARNKAYAGFKDGLLREIDDLENDLSQLQDMQTKMKVILEQHQRKTSSTLLHHVRQVKSLRVNQVKDSKELNEHLGRHLQHCMKQILKQEVTGMQKKLMQDAQHQELQQMKKGLQTMFMF